MMINHRSHSMRSSRKIRTYLLSVSLKTWDSLGVGLLLLVSYTDAFFIGDPLKLKGLLFLTV
ncbi:unnamed protein product [Musa acuminata subsp. malaccensis]|uniref:(wild Malaysian banana) hypothetical protein n=1 Tax=Musa acuminata subsp. malaccensis TaxID=214687 RepID=A0A8D7FDZ2_MUSAM|nr:unnamed protein product [Musa acuminata subsp. malaccensis]